MQANDYSTSQLFFRKTFFEIVERIELGRIGPCSKDALSVHRKYYIHPFQDPVHPLNYLFFELVERIELNELGVI